MRPWRHLFAIAVIIGFAAAGGLVGIAARWWVGGLNGQRAQLHECVLASERAHPNEKAASRLGHLEAEVPDCMQAAGYAKALDNSNCGQALWQGNVYCYTPKGGVGRLLFKIVAAL
jgi:hypothetical protein